MSHVTNQVFYANSYHPIQAGSIDGTDTAPHDNGVHRALLASSTGLYDPTGDPKAVGDPYCTLFVGKLARHTTEETLEEVMGRFGRIKNLRLVRDIGASRGYAFVEYETDAEMVFAYERAHYTPVDGSQIMVDYNRQQLMPGWIPRRLGGGLGGRKESGQLRFGGRDRPFRAPLRPIPGDQLKKLGIPLPPVGRYMSRHALPPIPRRAKASEDSPPRHGRHHRDTSSFKVIGEEDYVRYSDRAASRGKLEEHEAKSSSLSRQKRGRHSVAADYDAQREGKKHDKERFRDSMEDYRAESASGEDSRKRSQRYGDDEFYREKRERSLENHPNHKSGFSDEPSGSHRDRHDRESKDDARDRSKRSSRRHTASRDDAEYDKTSESERGSSRRRHERREKRRSRRDSADDRVGSSRDEDESRTYRGSRHRRE